MKRLASFSSAILFLLFLAGCGSSGKNFPMVHVEDIQIGETTQAQILDWFGIALKESHQGGLAMWAYQFDTYSSFSDAKSRELVVLFDVNLRVKAYRYESNMD